MNIWRFLALAGAMEMVAGAAGCAEQMDVPAVASPSAAIKPAADSIFFTNQDPLYTAAQSLVDWWPAKGHGFDLAGSRHAMLAEGATFAPGRAGGEAFTFDGEKGWVDCGAAEPSIPAGAFTMMFWVRSDKQNEGNGWQYLMHCWDNGGVDVAINFPKPGSFCLGVGTGAGDDADLGKLYQNVYLQNEPDELWHHFAMTFDGRQVCIYRDGRLGASEAWSIYTPGNVRLTLGRCVDHGTSSRPFKGQMQDVALFSRALDAGQVEAIARVQSKGTSGAAMTEEEAARFAAGLKGGRGPMAWYAALRLSGTRASAEKFALASRDGFDPAMFATWLRQLGSDEWAVREAATGHLREWGSGARPALAAALMRAGDPEVKARLELLLTETHVGGLDADQIREVRLREVLLRIGGEEARGLAGRISVPREMVAPATAARPSGGGGVSDHLGGNPGDDRDSPVLVRVVDGLHPEVRGEDRSSAAE